MGWREWPLHPQSGMQKKLHLSIDAIMCSEIDAHDFRLHFAMRLLDSKIWGSQVSDHFFLSW